MARKKPAAQRELLRLQQNRIAISEARVTLARGPLGALLQRVSIVECEGRPQDPRVAAVDPLQAAIHLNPHQGSVLPQSAWEEAIAHMLLHLGLNHAARREEREPLLWNIACDEVADSLLPLFRLRARSPGTVEREEQVYERLADEIAADRQRRRWFRTYAGENRPDILGLGRFQPWRKDFEDLLGEGIRRAVEDTVAEVAETLGEESSAGARWAPGERARRWVQNEFPLLGALSMEIRIIADARLCDRMDISVAAVDGYLGEMYFHPGWNLAHEEWVFIYAHELLHVALLHHTRSRGRDPWIWNLACDFVINGWLVEMGVGKLPSIGALYDPRLQGMSADEIYDLLVREPRRCKGLRGFRGRLGDVLLDSPGRRIYRGDVTTLDDLYRRCLAVGLACMGRGTLPAGLDEEIRALFSPPPPWDVELGRWFDAHVPFVRETLRSYARASRRQASTPGIPRPARYVPQEWLEACTFGVVLDTSGSMDRELLGRALGTIASFCEARDVPAVRLVLCDAAPYDRGFVSPVDLRGVYPVRGRGGTVLQPAVNHLLTRPDFPPAAPVMIITDGWCEEEITVPREHCFVLPRRRDREGAIPLRTTAPVFRLLKEAYFEE